MESWSSIKGESGVYGNLYLKWRISYTISQSGLSLIYGAKTIIYKIGKAMTTSDRTVQFCNVASFATVSFPLRYVTDE